MRRSTLSLSLRTALALIAFLCAPPARPQSGEVFPPSAVAPGDGAVSGFSGTVLSAGSLRPGVNPVDKTVIDVEGASLRVFDLTALGGTPAGQLVHPPVKFSVPAQGIGQVFSLAFDNGTPTDPPNLYAGATSAYGIQIVETVPDEDGTPVRLKQGAPNARFMDGQFGSLPGAGPGTIYKIEGRTGEASALADTAFTGVPNSGPGLGGLAFDPTSRNLYASDLDTGDIHRFALDYNAADLGQFDHGVRGRPARGLPPVADDATRMDITKPTFKPDDISTYGFTQTERRVRALAVHNGRLYYAVDDGPEIWSVGLNQDGGFNAEDVRSELLVKADGSLPVTSIVFDGQGRMILAQRGAPKSPYDYSAFVEPGETQVLRYTKEEPDDPATPGAWAPEPQSYAVGFGEGNKSASGGAALQYAYRPDGSIDLDSCYGTLAETADGLAPDGSGHGLQLNDTGLVLPAADPLRQSSFVEFDSRQDKADLTGHVGAVAVFDTCAGEGGPPIAGASSGYPPAGGSAFPPVGGGFPPAGAFPPVEGEPPPILGEPPVVGESPPPGERPFDPDAPNLAVLKTQTCKLLSADKAECEYKVAFSNTGKTPFETDDLTVEDHFSVPPASFTTEGFGDPTKTADGFRTKPNRSGAFTVPPGPAFSSPIKASFGVPAGGLTVENCVSFIPPAKGAPLVAPFTPVETLPDQPDLPASTSNGLDRAVAITGAPQCFARGNMRDCSWTVTISNPGTVASNVAFTFTTSKPALAIGGPGGHAVTRKDATTTVFQGGDLPPKAVKSVTIKATFPLEPGPVSGTAVVSSEFVNDVNAANNSASAAAGTAEPQVVPSPGVASADNNPADNTSCIKWDSTKPTEQGTPTNTPTIPLGPSTGQKTTAGQLQIAKSATVTTCSDVGGGCEFKITVSNPGPGDFTGPIEIDDNVTADGAIIGTTLMDTVPELPWRCAQTGQAQGGISCTHPNPLSAGGKVDLNLSLRLGASTSATHIRNCAVLKGTTTQACAEILLSKTGQPKLRGTKRLRSGDCAPDCEFDILITNVGQKTFKGQVGVTDTLTPTGSQFSGGIPATFVKVADTGKDFVCTAPATGWFVCNHPEVELPPGHVIGLRLKVTVNQLNASGENCVSVTPKDVADNEQAGRCVPFSSTPVAVELPKVPIDIITPSPPEVPNIAIEKRAITQHCPLVGPCSFETIIKNLGNGAFQGNLEIRESLLTNQVLSLFFPHPENIPCVEDGSQKRNRICTLKDVSLPAGSIMSYAVNIHPSFIKGETEPFLKNCAALLSLHGTGNDPNSVTIDNDSCDTMGLDPFALQITKTGGQSCQPGGDCRFDLEIFNPGPVVHNAPVTVTDNLTGLESAKVVSIVPAADAKPFPCSPAPTQIPFSCSGHMRLEVEERHKYTMTIKLPQDAPASGSFKNCASIASGEAAASQAGEADSAPAVATAAGRTPAPQDCHEVKLAPACTGGMELNAEGRCACPEGQKWDGRACAVEKEACPPGTTGTPPDCKAPSSGGGADTSKSEPAAAPACDIRACAAAYKSFRASDCTYQPRGGGPRQLCDKTKAGEGSVTPKVPGCPSDRPIGTPPNCCPKGMEYKRGACRCLEGTQLNKRGVCVEIPKAPLSCPRDRPVGTPPNCCPKGTEYKNGACQQSQQQKPKRECPSGYRVLPRPNKYGAYCEPIEQAPPKCPADRPVGTPPQCCPNGTRFTEGACWPLTCSPGWTGTPPHCQPPAQAPPSPPPAKCPSFMVGTPPNCKCPSGLMGPRCDQVIVR